MKETEKEVSRVWTGQKRKKGGRENMKSTYLPKEGEDNMGREKEGQGYQI